MNRDPQQLTQAAARAVSDRLWRRVDMTDDCWLWTGPVNNRGYGTTHTPLRPGPMYVHRLAYAIHKGDLPDSMSVDHLCGVPLCCNPAHLECVTKAENTRRRMRQITTCKHGHPFDLTIIRRGVPTRECSTCRKDRVDGYRATRNARKREARRRANLEKFGTPCSPAANDGVRQAAAQRAAARAEKTPPEAYRHRPHPAPPGLREQVAEALHAKGPVT